MVARFALLTGAWVALAALPGAVPIAITGAALSLWPRGLRPQQLPWLALTAVVAALCVLGALWGLSEWLIAAIGGAWLITRAEWDERTPPGAVVLATLPALLLGVAHGPDPQWVAGIVLAGAATPAVLQRAGRPFLPMLLCGATAMVVFALVPRCTETHPHGMTGLSDTVALGDIGPLLDDPAVVAIVRTQPEVEGMLYLRAQVLGAFDGTTWRSDEEKVAQIPGAPITPMHAAGEEIWVEIEQQPLPGGVLLTAGAVGHGRLESGRQVFAHTLSGSWFATRPDEPHTYRLLAAPPLAPDPLRPVAPDVVVPGERAARLRLPPGLDPRIVDLARSSATGSTTDRIASLVAILGELPYGRAEPGVGLSDFLIEGRAGHCEYFATALAVLARSAGIPSRLVTGFAVEMNEREQPVRLSDAHAWTELYVEDGGWVAVDATPARRTPVASATWSDALRVVLADLDAARPWDALLVLFRWLDTLPSPPGWRGPVLLVGGMLLVAGGARWHRRRATVPLRGITRLHERAKRHLESAGWEIPSHLPPVAAAEWVRARADEPEAEALVALAWLYYRIRLGGEAEARRLDEAKELLRRVRRIGAPSF